MGGVGLQLHAAIAAELGPGGADAVPGRADAASHAGAIALAAVVQVGVGVYTGIPARRSAARATATAAAALDHGPTRVVAAPAM